MAYAYDASLLERVKPRISQWEATTGRRMSPQMLDSLYKQQLETEAARGTQERALDLQAQQIADQKQAQKDAASAAKTKGLVDIASTAGTGYLAYKALSKPSAMQDLIAYQKSMGAQPLGTATPSVGAPAYTAPTATSPTIPYGGGVTAAEPAFSATTGAQTAMAGGAPAAVGAQTALGPVTAAPATGVTYGVAGEMGAGLGTGAATGTGAALLNAAPMIGLAYTAQQMSAPYVNKVVGDKWNMPNAAKGWQYGGLPGASIGAGVDIGKKVVNEASDVVKSIVGVVEDASVVCSELLRQKRITQEDRTKCVVFRSRHIDDRLFDAYLEWARPIVTHMRRQGVMNLALLPFTKRFVGYMISVQNKKIPTLGQRLVWKYAMFRCSRIANRGISFRLRSA